MVGSQTVPQEPLVEQVLSMLSAEERCAITLRHARSMGVAQIAACMGCPRRAAERALRTAEAKVRAAQRALLEALLEIGRGPDVTSEGPRHAPRNRARAGSAPVAEKHAKVRAAHGAVTVEVART
jgi:predicted DNA-binding protein (UPF0251 family)